MNNHLVTAADVHAARRAFKAKETRDLFYRAATELVGLALKGSTSLSLAEALAVLLQTWNKAYYQYRKFDERHLAKIERLLSKRSGALAKYRSKTLRAVARHERVEVSRLFGAFERVLGPVGAAKSLHLLAPRVFPIWDRTIAHVYGLSLGKAGSNGDRYWRFMLITREQCRGLSGKAHGRNPLKAIDEYNYCKHTKKWI